MDLKDFIEINGYDGRYYINKNGDVWNNHKEFFVPLRERKGTKKPTYILHYNGKSTSTSLDSLMSKYFPEFSDNINDIEGEIWVDIKSYENEYMISSFGRVKSLDRYIEQNGTQRFMKGRLLSANRNNGNGYINVQLGKGSESDNKNSYVHILVATHFIENPNNYNTVNHKDFNKSNNNIENLEWCSQKDNLHHYLENSEKHFNKDTELLCEINKMFTNGMSVSEISKLKNIEYPRVLQIINSRTYKSMFN